MSSATPAAPAPLHIVVDEPTTTLGLGYGEYVDALASVVIGGDPARFTIGIYGAWGVGKSSILKALKNTLVDDDRPVISFDAWRYARSNNVIVPLLYEIEDQLSPKNQAIWKSIGRGLRAVTSEIGLSAAGINVSGNALGAAIDAAREPRERRRADVPHYRLQEIGEDLTAAEKRIVILVDDLDRCPPDAIVDLLEAIHVLTDVQGFIFVLALDYEVLLEAVRARYPHANPALFIEKIIQIPFWIPEVDRSGSVITEIVPEWESRLSLDERGANTLQKVVHLALRTNPRQVKRLINSMLIAQRILGAQGGDKTDGSLLLGVIGLQLQWPNRFKNLHIALANDPDSEFLEDFSEYKEAVDSDARLSLYLAEVLPASLDASQTLAAMKYSQTTASAQAQPIIEDENKDEDISGPLLAEIEAGPHEETFTWIKDLLTDSGATFVVRQQYIAFKKGRKAFLRVDAFQRVGTRLFFPDSMEIDREDEERFSKATGARATNFERTLIVPEREDEFAMKYIRRALPM
jgi:GTPase SAR1 family protein